MADAGLTPFYVIKMVLPKLAGGGKHWLLASVAGVGGLYILRAITGAQIIATDRKPSAMARARDFGAVTVADGPDQAGQIRELTGGRGVDVVFDFVGADPTMRLAQATVAIRGAIQVVGIGGGSLVWNFFTNPDQVTLTNTYWGTIEDLYEVVALYATGARWRRTCSGSAWTTPGGLPPPARRR